HELAAALAAAAERLEPAAAAPVAAKAVAAVIAAIGKTTGYSAENQLLMDAFSRLAATLGPADAAAVIEQTVARLTQPPEKNERRGIMASVEPEHVPLRPVVARLAPADASACCRKA